MDLIYALVYVSQICPFNQKTLLLRFVFIQSNGNAAEGFKRDADMTGGFSKVRLTLAGKGIGSGQQWIKMNLWGGFGRNPPEK